MIPIHVKIALVDRLSVLEYDHPFSCGLVQPSPTVTIADAYVRSPFSDDPISLRPWIVDLEFTVDELLDPRAFGPAGLSVVRNRYLNVVAKYLQDISTLWANGNDAIDAPRHSRPVRAIFGASIRRGPLKENAIGGLAVPYFGSLGVV